MHPYNLYKMFPSSFHSFLFSLFLTTVWLHQLLIRPPSIDLPSLIFPTYGSHYAILIIMGVYWSVYSEKLFEWNLPENFDRNNYKNTPINFPVVSLFADSGTFSWLWLCSLLPDSGQCLFNSHAVSSAREFLFSPIFNVTDAWLGFSTFIICSIKGDHLCTRNSILKHEISFLSLSLSFHIIWDYNYFLWITKPLL